MPINTPKHFLLSLTSAQIMLPSYACLLGGDGAAAPLLQERPLPSPDLVLLLPARACSAARSAPSGVMLHGSCPRRRDAPGCALPGCMQAACGSGMTASAIPGGSPRRRTRASASAWAASAQRASPASRSPPRAALCMAHAHARHTRRRRRRGARRRAARSPFLDTMPPVPGAGMGGEGEGGGGRAHARVQQQALLRGAQRVGQAHARHLHQQHRQAHPATDDHVALNRARDLRAGRARDCSRERHLGKGQPRRSWAHVAVAPLSQFVSTAPAGPACLPSERSAHCALQDLAAAVLPSGSWQALPLHDPASPSRQTMFTPAGCVGHSEITLARKQRKARRQAEAPPQSRTSRGRLADRRERQAGRAPTSPRRCRRAAGGAARTRPRRKRPPPPPAPRPARSVASL